MRPSLDHDASPEAFGLAMSMCQGYAPACSDAGECSYGRFCFSRSGNGFGAAHKALTRLIEQETNVHARVWLKLALDYIEHQKFLENGAIDAWRASQVMKRVREECGWPLKIIP